MGPLVVDGRKKVEKIDLYNAGRRQAEKFLEKNEIKNPKYVLVDAVRGNL